MDPELYVAAIDMDRAIAFHRQVFRAESIQQLDYRTSVAGGALWQAAAAACGTTMKA